MIDDLRPAGKNSKSTPGEAAATGAQQSVFVVCQNDFPDAAFASKAEAELYAAAKLEAERSTPDAPYLTARTSFWHIQEIPLFARAEPANA